MAQSRDETAKRPNSALGSCGHDAEGASKGIAEEQRSQEISEQQVDTGFQKGCLSSLVVIATIRNATEYGRSTKWALTTLAAMAALAAPLGSNIILRESKFSFIPYWRQGRVERQRKPATDCPSKQNENPDKKKSIYQNSCRVKF